MELDETLLKLKAPSKSVIVPLVVFFTKIFTPGKGILSAPDLTVPETENVCEKAKEVHSVVIKKE
tara:strand:- start:786 stop:980 length:195 start_codon:yes stop_codon:yes gene_type:complete